MIEGYAPPALSSAAIPVRSRTGQVIPEERLVLQAQKGSLEAFNQLVLLYQDRVFNQAFWVLREKEADEDVTQESFLLAYSKLDTFRGGPFRPWLLRIVTNYCLDQLRYAKRRLTQRFEITNEEGDEVEADWIRDPGESPEQVLERSEFVEEMIA